MKVRMQTVFFCVLLLYVSSVAAQDLKYLEYDSDLTTGQVYKERREKLMQQIGDDAVALFYANPERNRNADLDFPSAQNSDFYYLTGFKEPNAILVLAQKGISVRSLEDSTQKVSVKEILFVYRYLHRSALGGGVCAPSCRTRT